MLDTSNQVSTNNIYIMEFFMRLELKIVLLLFFVLKISF